MYAEHSTCSFQQFPLSLVEHAPFMIHEVQTDNGTEFTKRLISNDPNDKTLFELELERAGIIHHLLRPSTPRHNGKAERQHRIDKLRFYQHIKCPCHQRRTIINETACVDSFDKDSVQFQRKMYSLEDGRKQLARYQRVANDNIMTCLHMRSHNQVLALYEVHIDTLKGHDDFPTDSSNDGIHFNVTGQGHFLKIQQKIFKTSAYFDAFGHIFSFGLLSWLEFCCPWKVEFGMVRYTVVLETVRL